MFELDLPENQIEELNAKISNKVTLSEKVECLRNELETLEMEIIDSFLVVFSNKSLTNSQCSSEINKLKKENIGALQNGFINNFLLNKPILENGIIPINSKFIKITSLNAEQEAAVKSVFTNKLTIITGPPGTGKTQVVMNIIANAIVKGKTVLFASKNNKAVDNVRDRFKNILKDDYLVRIGSKDIITNIQKPVFDSFVNRIIAGEFAIEPNMLENYAVEIDSVNSRINEIKNLLNLLKRLPGEITFHRERYRYLKDDYQSYIISIPKVENELFMDQNKEFKVNLNTINLLLNKLKRSNSNFVYRIFYKWFKYSNDIGHIVDLEKNIDNSVLNYLNSISPLFVDGISELRIIIKHLEQLICVYNNSHKHIAFKQTNRSERKNEKDEIEVKELKLNKLNTDEKALRNELVELDSKLLELSCRFLNRLISNKLNSTIPATIQNYKNYIPETPWKWEELGGFEKACKEIIQQFNSVCVTNLSIKNGFSLTKDLFDILVIDEASQCDIASAIPLIFRARQVVVIGDPLQLRHITSVQTYEERFVKDALKIEPRSIDYVDKSLFDFSNELAIDSGIYTHFLNEHFRCHPKIIGFSNEHFYIPKLGRALEIKTFDCQFVFGDKGIIWYNVKGEGAKSKNFNTNERDKVIDIAKELLIKYPECEIGITTPFRNQEELIKQEYSKLGDGKNRVVIQTIHKFQGDEKDIIIFSLVVNNECKSSLTNFINVYAQYLLNVAVTRARSSLYIVGDFEYCKNHNKSEETLLMKLAKYVEKNGKILN